MSPSAHDRFLERAARREGIELVLLIGSRASGGKADGLSDWDLVAFCDDPGLERGDGAWARELGEVLLARRETIRQGNAPAPAIKIVFAGGERLDICFLPRGALRDFIVEGRIPESYEGGYLVELDKTGSGARLKAPSGRAFLAREPTEAEFRDLVEGFWLEAFQLRKHLRRADLLAAKIADFSLKYSLYKMLEINSGARADWELPLGYMGKGLGAVADEAAWRRLFGCFSRFDLEDSERGFASTIALFRDLARETAGIMGLAYREGDYDGIARLTLDGLRDAR